MRGARYWFAGFGLLGFLCLYVAPIVQAVRAPVFVTPLPSVVTPRVWYPPLTIPKLHAPPALPKVPKATSNAATAQAPTTKRRRLPVTTDKFTLAPPPAKTTPAKKKATSNDPFANVPVVADTVGAPIAVTGAEPDPAPGEIDDSVGAPV